MLKKNCVLDKYAREGVSRFLSKNFCRKFAFCLTMPKYFVGGPFGTCVPFARKVHWRRTMRRTILVENYNI